MVVHLVHTPNCAHLPYASSVAPSHNPQPLTVSVECRSGVCRGVRGFQQIYVMLAVHYKCRASAHVVRSTLGSSQHRSLCLCDSL